MHARCIHSQATSANHILTVKIFVHYAELTTETRVEQTKNLYQTKLYLVDFELEKPTN